MATTNTPWCGVAADKLYLQSGGASVFSATLKDSEDVSGSNNTVNGVEWDGTNFVWCGQGPAKLYLQSGSVGAFSATIKTSVGVATGDVADISDDGTNALHSHETSDKIILSSGKFTTTVKSSVDFTAVDNDITGCSTDGTDIWSCGTEADKLYKSSGFASLTLKDSQAIGVTTNPSGISWNGTDTPWTSFTGAKLYLQSGQFSVTLKTSRDVSGIDTQPHGISTDDFTSRIPAAAFTPKIISF